MCTIYQIKTHRFCFFLLYWDLFTCQLGYLVHSIPFQKIFLSLSSFLSINHKTTIITSLCYLMSPVGMGFLFITASSTTCWLPSESTFSLIDYWSSNIYQSLQDFHRILECTSHTSDDTLLAYNLDDTVVLNLFKFDLVDIFECSIHVCETFQVNE